MRTTKKLLIVTAFLCIIFSLMNFKKNDNLILKNKISYKSKNYSNWSGIYVDKFGTTLKIKGPAPDGAVIFEYLQTSQSCIGQIEGTAYLTSNYVANYQDEGQCHLTFTYNPGTIQISENNCDEYRGASCGTFDGFFKKKINKKKRK